MTIVFAKIDTHKPRGRFAFYDAQLAVFINPDSSQLFSP
jgi:hypothetical protein